MPGLPGRLQDRGGGCPEPAPPVSTASPAANPDPFRHSPFRKPNGVYAGITSWNFPTLIPVELIAPAIAVGNTIVVKPSEWTPVAMANFAQIMADAGLPDALSEEGERELA